MKRVFVWAVVAAALAVPAAADHAADDLQAVKKAVLAASGSQIKPPAEDPGQGPAEAKPQGRAKGEPMWFRVRIVGKSGQRAHVSVNLPIGLVRSLGDDWPIPQYHGCRGRDRCGATLGEILRALDAGQNLVEIENDEATVRVWID